MSDENTPQRKGRAGPGRRTVRTPEKEALLLGAISRGIPFGTSCSLVGVSYTSFCNWRRIDSKFEQRVQEALAKGIARAVQKIFEAAETDWRSAAWWLERVAPEHFSRNRIEISGPGGAPLAAAI